METCEPEDSDADQDDHELQNDETQSWIGVIHIPVLEYYNARGSKSCSVLERVCVLLFCFRFCRSKTIYYIGLVTLVPGRPWERSLGVLKWCELCGWMYPRELSREIDCIGRGNTVL